MMRKWEDLSELEQEIVRMVAGEPPLIEDAIIRELSLWYGKRYVKRAISRLKKEGIIYMTEDDGDWEPMLQTDWVRRNDGGFDPPRMGEGETGP